MCVPLLTSFSASKYIRILQCNINDCFFIGSGTLRRQSGWNPANRPNNMIQPKGTSVSDTRRKMKQQEWQGVKIIPSTTTIRCPNFLLVPLGGCNISIKSNYLLYAWKLPAHHNYCHPAAHKMQCPLPELISSPSLLLLSFRNGSKRTELSLRDLQTAAHLPWFYLCL